MPRVDTMITDRIFKSKIQMALALPLFGIAAAFLWLMREVNSRYLPESDLVSLVDGTGATPFQYRFLVPALVRIARACWPALPIGAAFRAIDIAATSAVLILMVIFLRRRGLSIGWVVVGYLMLVANYAGPYVNFMCYYDMLSIAFFIAGLLVIEKQQWRFFYPLLVVALINRESAALLIAAFVLIENKRLTSRQLAAHVCGQLALFILVKGGLWWAFLDNRGFGLASTLYISVNDPPPTDPPISRIWLNVVWITCYAPMTLFAGMWLPAAIGARISPDSMVRKLLWIVPLDLVIMSVVGTFWEPRIFNELVPIVLLAGASSIELIVGRAVSGFRASCVAHSERRPPPSRSQSLPLAPPVRLRRALPLWRRRIQDGDYNRPTR